MNCQNILSLPSRILSEAPQSLFDSLDISIKKDGQFTISLYNSGFKKPVSIEGSVIENGWFKFVKLVSSKEHSQQLTDCLTDIIDDIFFERLKRKPVSEEKRRELEAQGEVLVVWD